MTMPATGSATPPPPSAPLRALEAFVFNPDQFFVDDVPRDLDPAQIELFVRLRITALAKPADLEQLFKVVDYYDVYEVAVPLWKLLNRNEKNPEELLKSAIIARIIAVAGLPEDVAKAKDYYDYLVGRAETYAVQERMVALYEVLGPMADAKALTAKLDARMKALARDKDKSDEARADFNQAERLLNFTLSRASRANDVKKTILEIADRNARIAEEVKMYLAMQYGFGEYLPLFAARRLKRETWAEQPAQQIKRAINPPLRDQVMQALRKALPAIKALSLTDEEKTFMTVAALDAVNFFAGVLDKTETEMLAGPGAMQKNILTFRKFH